MKQYNPKSTCPKCGSEDINSLWVAANAYRWEMPPGDGETREHINRRCRRCGVQWNEAPLDSQDEVG